jgi:hypothetical protein
MKKIIALFLFAAFLPLTATAADDFGTRFGGQSPSALIGRPTAEDRMMALEGKRLQTVAPAAGEETPAAAPAENAPPANQPEADALKIEEAPQNAAPAAAAPETKTP